MKQLIFTLLATSCISLTMNAQEVSVTANSSVEGAKLAFKEDTVKQQAVADTSIVRIGKKDIEVIDRDRGTEIVWGKHKRKRNHSEKFNGHWEGIEFGFNGFDKPDYSMYDPADNNFMSLNQGKSIEFDFNFYELNIGLVKNYVGLISGMGLTFNDYRFENPYTLQREANMTVPQLISYDNLSKTKLSVSYLTVPILLEFQIPVNNNEGRLFVNAGLVGGVKIGSHTKVKHGDIKDKDHDGFNINSFNYSAVARIGYKDISLFAKYSRTPLFESGKGPELTPFTIGISFLN